MELFFRQVRRQREKARADHIMDTGIGVNGGEAAVDFAKELRGQS